MRFWRSIRAGMSRWWLVGSLWAAGGTEAGGASFRMQHWHADHGLPQNTVQALHQTRDGYVWVGTRFGLARFDGVRFHTVPVPPEDSGVADSINTRVLTPSRMIRRISRSYRVSLPTRGVFLLRKLCDSSMTTRS